MNKRIIFAVAAILTCGWSVRATVVTAPESPFNFAPLEMYDFPAKDFPITKYGAKPSDLKANISAFKKAMEACNKAGGGHVVVPAGEWLTGPIHFRSNCDLHLEEGAVIVFEDNKDLYLPAVQVSWEGMECMNWSPLVYAFECENIAITGKGKLAPKMEFWRTWYDRPENHMKASHQLYAMASTDVPVKYRDMVELNAEMRPHLIHLNRCKNIQLSDFDIFYSPFWTIHLLLCKDVWVHGINNFAHGHNPDGLDVEMTQHILIEDCTFDQGDDGVCLKAGRNRDGWRLNTPTQDVVMRRCHVKCAGGIIVCGSELSGGIRRVYAHDCTADRIYRVLNIKTNERRGGFVRDIMVENVKVKDLQAVFRIVKNAIFQWVAVPTFEVRLTEISGITVRNIEAGSVDYLYHIDAESRMPARDITLENIKADMVYACPCVVNNAIDLKVNNVTFSKMAPKGSKHVLDLKEYRERIAKEQSR